MSKLARAEGTFSIQRTGTTQNGWLVVYEETLVVCTNDSHTSHSSSVKTQDIKPFDSWEGAVEYIKGKTALTLVNTEDEE